MKLDVFSWSNKYFIGTLVSSSSTNIRLQVAAVHNSGGISIYIINKFSTSVTFSLSQSGAYSLGTGTFYSIAKLKYYL